MWETIKQILRKNQGTCIIVEEGKPTYVIARFDDYRELLEGQAAAPATPGHLNEQELLEKINEEITNWKAKQVEANPDLEMAEPKEDAELKIENLPII